MSTPYDPDPFRSKLANIVGAYALRRDDGLKDDDIGRSLSTIYAALDRAVDQIIEAFGGPPPAQHELAQAGPDTLHAQDH